MKFLTKPVFNKPSHRLRPFARTHCRKHGIFTPHCRQHATGRLIACARYLSKLMKKLLAFFIGCCLGISAAYTQPAKQTNNPWPLVKKETRPWTRWWWMGNAVDDKNTARLLDTYHQAGFGGVEVTPIYGAIGYENRYLQFLSPQWMSALDFTIAKAHSVGMGVDMNTGTGWPFGGPQVSSANAAAKLIIQTYTITAGQPFAGKIVVNDAKQASAGAPLQALTAYGDNGEVL